MVYISIVRLRLYKFSYKKPKGTPAKADLAKQAAFVQFYESLLNTTPEDEPILFVDGVHGNKGYLWLDSARSRQADSHHSLKNTDEYSCGVLWNAW